MIPHQALGKVILTIAGCQPHVLGHAAAEGVCAFVQSARLEIEVEQLHNLQPQCALTLACKWADRLDHPLACLFVTYPCHQVREPATHLAEQAGEIGCPRARLITVE